MMNQSTKDSIFNMLSEALNVCEKVNYGEEGLHDTERSPFYAVGYSKSAIKATLEMLTRDQ
jgi:hypothetical protein